MQETATAAAARAALNSLTKQVTTATPTTTTTTTTTTYQFLLGHEHALTHIKRTWHNSAASCLSHSS